MRNNSSGFTLLEVIGVLAVMAIMAGALAPSVFQMINEGYQAAERQSLNAVADGFESYVRQNKEIPDTAPAVWAAAIAEHAALPTQRVLNNEKGFARKVFFDPKFFTNKNQTFTGYVQSQGLASKPYSARMMIASDLNGSIKASLNNHKQFEAVWEQSSKAKLKETKNLLIKRVNLSPMFVRVILSNASTNQVGYVLEAGSEGAISAASGGIDGSRTVYVIRDTQLQLNAAPYPGGATQRRLVVSSEHSLRYQFDGGDWAWSG